MLCEEYMNIYTPTSLLEANLTEFSLVIQFGVSQRAFLEPVGQDYIKQNILMLIKASFSMF